MLWRGLTKCKTGDSLQSRLELGSDKCRNSGFAVESVRRIKFQRGVFVHFVLLCAAALCLSTETLTGALRSTSYIHQTTFDVF